MRFIEMKVSRLRCKALEPQRSEFINFTSPISALACSVLALVFFIYCSVVHTANSGQTLRCMRAVHFKVAAAAKGLTFTKSSTFNSIQNSLRDTVNLAFDQE